MDERLRQKNRRAFLLLAVIFLGTPLAAFIAFRYTDLGKGATVNHGRLIEPPLALDVEATPVAGGAPFVWRDTWTLVRVEAAACDAGCRADLHTSHQVWLLTNRDQPRVRRVLISAAPETDLEALQAAEPELVVLDGRDPGVAAVAARLRSGTPGAGLYLVDPFGNLMMTYPSPLDPKGLQADLKRLLKLSEPWMRKP